jgi:putative heme iron utilization protein
MPTTDQPTASALTPADRARILSHMNEDHADAVLAYARHLGARPAATAATLAALDPEGMDLVVTEPGGDIAVRIHFSTALVDATDAHHILVRLAKESAAALRAAAPASTAPAAKAAAALERARDAVAFLRGTLKTIQLGTVSAAGEPDCSVAPYVVAPSGDLLTYVSDLSLHTANLRANGHATVLLIEDEATAGHLLARRRLTIATRATFIPREHEAFAPGKAALRGLFAPVMEHLEKMHDFHLVSLAPERARLVAGFGQAYDTDPRDWTRLRHVNDQGHAKAPAAHKS